MAAFKLGVMHGVGTSVVAVVIYSVPATLFDWPRITLADLASWSATLARDRGFFASLFDW
jgi:hypothetical protein